MFRKACIVLITLSSLAACDATSNDTTSKISSNILDISEYDVTLNNKPASYIKFGENDKNHCSLAVLKASATKGYHLKIEGSSSLDIETDLTCMKENNIYTMSTTNNTFISVDTIEATDSKVAYRLNSKLTSPQDQSFYEIKDMVLVITGEKHKTLIK